MPQLQTGETHYHAQLGLPDKGSATRGLVVNVYCSMAKINDLWDGYKDQRKVAGLVPCCGEDGYQTQVLKHPIDSHNIYMI